MKTPNSHRYSRLAAVFAIALTLNFSAHAQTKIEGKYNSKKKKFEATNSAYTFGDFRDAFATFRLNDKR